MNLPEIFKNYLIIKKNSPVTAKNYFADVNHFLNWLAEKTGVKYQIVGKAIFGLFTEETLDEYKADLLKNKTPLSTLNRKLSALRKFGQFGKEQGWLTVMPRVKNITSTLKEDKQHSSEITLENFQQHLLKEKISHLTIKNYLSDLRHFLGWLGNN